VKEPKTTPRRIVAQPYDFSVQDLVDKIKNEDIDLRPSYQRNYVWETNDKKENKRSRLIESLLLNIPIPVIYFAEQEETLKYEVIDGQQRLKTFLDYLNDGFELRDLEIRSDVNGHKYSELSQRDKDEIRKRSIRAIVILNESDEEVKYEVFERLNLGSVQLTPQEIRNNTLRGTFNTLLKDLAKNPKFQEMLSLRLKKDAKNMAHEELVLRFFAYYYRDLKRANSLSYFLTDFMKEKRNISSTEALSFRVLFESTVNQLYKYLGKNAFCLFGKKGWYPTSNRSLFDAEMLAFAKLKDKNDLVNPDIFKNRLQDLMQDPEFRKSLVEQAGGKKVEARVNNVKKLLLKQNASIKS